MDEALVESVYSTFKLLNKLSPPEIGMLVTNHQQKVWAKIHKTTQDSSSTIMHVLHEEGASKLAPSTNKEKAPFLSECYTTSSNITLMSATDTLHYQRVTPLLSEHHGRGRVKEDFLITAFGN